VINLPEVLGVRNNRLIKINLFTVTMLSTVALFTIFSISSCVPGPGKTNTAPIEKQATTASTGQPDTTKPAIPQPTNNKNLAGAFVVAWAPDRTKVAYIKYHGEGTEYRQDIFTSNADGSNEQRLTYREQEEYIALAWSPDGKKIAYVGTGAGYDYMQLWIMDSDGSNLKHLTGGPSVDSIGGPLVWSNDGRWIAFGYSRYGNSGYSNNRFNSFGPNYHTGQPDYSRNYDRRIIDINGNNESPMPAEFPSYHGPN
jgi:hypothetical protein